MTSRRTFLKMIPVACIGIAGTSLAFAETAKVKETDIAAVTLGYKENAKSVDPKKSPNYVAGQACKSCMFYQGQAGAAAGACPLFGGKLVSAGGWCNSYNKKAA